MIIKRKYTIMKQQSETDSNALVEEEKEDAVQSVETKKEDIREENISAEIKNEKKEEPPKNKSDDLDLTLDNIKFEQREEKREGTRRRGYRRTQDRNIISRAQKDALAIKEAAKKDGYNDGLEAAKKDLEDLKSNFSQFFGYKEEIFNKVSSCITDIALEAAKKIIGKEIETDKEYIISMVKNVLGEINKTENKITLKVMPKDTEILKDRIIDIFSGNGFDAKITVVADKEIKDGGVIVETSNGIIDASIASQLAIIEKALKKNEERQVD